MPLLNLFRRGSNQNNNEADISSLRNPIGNDWVGQGVFLTGTERAIDTTAGDMVQPTIRELLLNNVDVAAWAAAEGRVFYASDADQNDMVTGQTSFADTTPTFYLRVPAGTVAVPLMVALGQAGTVGGAVITVIIEVDNADRLNTGGTSETRFNTMTRLSPPGAVPQCTLLSGATAVTGYGARIMGIQVAQDVEPAEGISNEVIWTPTGPDFLVGPASFLVYTFAGTTGPTWLWTVKWAEFPIARFGF